LNHFTAEERPEAGFSLPLLQHHLDAGRVECSQRGVSLLQAIRKASGIGTHASAALFQAQKINRVRQPVVLNRFPF
jgi:hypothetical protein